mgnify:CR=1 FL=1
MHLIQQRQVAGIAPGPTLAHELAEFRTDLLSGTNQSYDILNSDIAFQGNKSFKDQVTFSGAVYMKNLPTCLYASGGIFLQGGNNFTVGHSALYMSAPNYYKFIINSNAGGGSGLLNLAASSGIVFSSPTWDLSEQDTDIEIVSTSSTALSISPAIGGPMLTLDTASTPPRFGFNDNTPAATLSITGTQEINANNADIDVITLRNSGNSQSYVAFHSLSGTSRVGTYDDTITPLSGFYIKAADALPLYLGHHSAQAMRIDYEGTSPRIRMGEWYGESRPLEAASSVVEIHNTGLLGPILALVNDSAGNDSSSAIKFVEYNTTAPTTGSWIMGYYDEGAGGTDNVSSFRIAYSGGATSAALGTNAFFSLNSSGSLTISGTRSGETTSITSAGVAEGGGNLNVSGNVTLTTGLIFAGYDNMPTSDPAIKGVVWRDSNTLKVSAG